MIRTILFGLIVSCAAAPAGAAFQYNFVGNTSGSTDKLGTFQGTLAYNASSSTAATLTVTLTNTSPAGNGGYLTAFVLENPGNRFTGILLTTPLTSPSSNFSLIGTAPFTNSGGVNAAPFGSFGFGASTGGSFEGGGNPHPGIGVGLTGTFIFAITGTGLDTFSAAQLTDPFFVARFRGFSNGGSDKVPSNVSILSPASVPEPASLALLGIGLGALGLCRARNRRRA